MDLIKRQALVDINVNLKGLNRETIDCEREQSGLRYQTNITFNQNTYKLMCLSRKEVTTDTVDDKILKTQADHQNPSNEVNSTVNSDFSNQNHEPQNKEDKDDTVQQDCQSQSLQLNIQIVQNDSPRSRKSSISSTPREKLRETLVISTSKKAPTKIDEEKESGSEKMINETKKEEETKQTLTPLDEAPSKSQSNKKVTLEDFTQLGIIGKGAYGEVILVKKKTSKRQYAMKVIDKKFLKMVAIFIINFE